MRRSLALFSAVSAMVSTILAMPTSAAETPFSRLYVFGDSYSDSGASRTVSNEAVNAKIPQAVMLPADDKTGLYWRGRWSNGPTAVEDLANKMGTPIENVAVGGARCGSGNYYTWLDGWRDTGLRGQVLSFIYARPRLDPAALYVLGASANDIFLHEDMATPQPLPAIAEQCAQEMKGAIELLQQHGARHFLIFGAYSLDRVPAVAKDPHAAAEARAFQAEYDRRAQTAIEPITASAGSRIIWFSWSNATEKLLANTQPERLSDVVHPCQPTLPAPGKVCGDPDAHLWWDEYHPTRRAHALVAQQILDVVRESASAH
ncbi:SGNH/GDSL hydrolase family protein [Acetobacter estunensis]|uniref:SGNH/GDSL hydrolase family protein n=1 Tax=Acetobacter estunensis TaxID=104097 RepID=UPI001C2CDB2F|nr:SGNH/GDSL hydrolase family protein [Acetobacter estunensis]MBV1835736.1 SGNH/GDSL hydrolase family protein [Acetobacter estunensis]MBV1836003.1 SGNH/GDSL hydrolase family protein [Acetobacter estunensis]